MRPTDIRVTGTDVTFQDVVLHRPLRLAGATISGFTVPLVRARVADRAGRTATGTGAGVLSVPWAWPRSTATPEARDRVLRDLVRELAGQAPQIGFADPIRCWQELAAALPGTADRAVSQVTSWVHASDGKPGHEDVAGASLPAPAPALAASLALAPLDAAIHDAWGRAAGRPAWQMYDADHLTDDLAGTLRAGALRAGAPGWLAGRYPADVLTAPRLALPVQHVVGNGDPLTGAEAGPGEVALADWLRQQGIRHLKIKLAGADPASDVARIAAVHRLLAAHHGSGGSLSLDPNEAYPDPRPAVELLDRLRRDQPAAWSALAYLEQPIPRDLPAVPVGAVARRVPVVADEGIASLADLPGLLAAGWNGLAAKAARGHSLSLLTACWARWQGLYLTVQDLTTVDLALLHSARLASHLPCSHPAFEYNSRQYAPAANAALAAREPALVQVRDGTVAPDPSPVPGLYCSGDGSGDGSGDW